MCRFSLSKWIARIVWLHELNKYDRMLLGLDEGWPGLTHQNANRSVYAWGLPEKMLAAKDIRN